MDVAWASAEIFPGGGNVDISLVLFQVADDRMQMDFHKTLYSFCTTKKIPRENLRSIRIFWNRIQVELYSSLRKGCTFCHPLQLFLNWGIIQYHYYCELQTTDSELDLNYPQLRLRCSHQSVRVEPPFSKLVRNVFYTSAIRNAFFS